MSAARCAAASAGPPLPPAGSFGAPVALDLAMRDPSRVLGLIVQNANAHRSGFAPQWLQDTLAYWRAPTPRNEQRATAHLSFAGVRDQYVGGIPSDIASRIVLDTHAAFCAERIVDFVHRGAGA